MSHQSNPAARAAPVVVDVAFAIGPSRAIYVGVTGNVVAVMNGVAVTFVAVPAGMILPIVATQVNSAGTTATSMVALF